MINVEIGQCLLKELLDQKRLTQQELAELTGFTKQDINGYVNNRRKMSLKTAKTISVALNCTIEELYVWTIQHNK